MPLLKARLAYSETENPEYRGVCIYCSRPIRFVQDLNFRFAFRPVAENCPHIRGIKSTGYCRWFVARLDEGADPIRPVIPNSLSAAILAGCKFGQQLFGQLMNERGDACTTGAALLGLGYTYEDVKELRGLTSTILRESFPVATENADCPECREVLEVIRLAAHLQDSHHWTREATAMVIARIEYRQQEALSA